MLPCIYIYFKNVPLKLCGSFQWSRETTLEGILAAGDDATESFLVEVDLDCPAELHDGHRDYFYLLFILVFAFSWNAVPSDRFKKAVRSVLK